MSGRYPMFDDGVCLWFDRQGKPMTMMEWAAKHGDMEYKRVAQHWVRGWMVSTVWLGLNHNWHPQGAPLIFETMIFAPGDVTISGDDDLHEFQERYPTEDAAQAGHDRALAAVVEKLGADSVADITGPVVPGSSDEGFAGGDVSPAWLEPLPPVD